VLTDQRFIIAEVRKRFPQSKIALVSKSRRTVTVGNILQHGPEMADLYVLISPESIARRHSGIADLGAPTASESRALGDSSEGGSDLLANSGSHSPHGFLGKQDRTLDDIDGWISQKLQATTAAQWSLVANSDCTSRSGRDLPARRHGYQVGRAVPLPDSVCSRSELGASRAICSRYRVRRTEARALRSALLRSTEQASSGKEKCFCPDISH
jgi:hypothetical protein